MRLHMFDSPNGFAIEPAKQTDTIILKFSPNLDIKITKCVKVFYVELWVTKISAACTFKLWPPF